MKNITKTYVEVHKVENAVAMPKFKPNWSTDVVTYKDTLGLNIRVTEPKGESGELRATLPIIPVFPGSQRYRACQLPTVESPPTRYRDVLTMAEPLYGLTRRSVDVQEMSYINLSYEKNVLPGRDLRELVA